MKSAIEPYVFLGRSGAGKGTQAALLIKYLQQADPAKPVLYMETGALLREFKAKDIYTAKLAKQIIDNGGGGRDIAFLAIYNWTNYFINQIRGGERVVIDGTPRTVIEAEALDTCFNFYGVSKPTLIHLNVKDDWAIDKLTKRGRADDTVEGIKKRLSWFTRDVEPVTEYYRSQPESKLLEINGEQTIEEVHQEIISKISV